VKAPARLPRLRAPGGKPKCSAALGYLDVNSILTELGPQFDPRALSLRLGVERFDHELTDE